jgi:hypothetical protein
MVRAMRFLVSTRTKFVVTFLALGSFLAGLVIIIIAGSGATREVTWALLGAGVALFVVALLAQQPQEACSFCHRPRGSLKYLASSTAASVCDGCIPLFMGVLTATLSERKPPESWQRAVLDGLPRNCPLSISRPLLQALADESKDPAALREVVSASLGLHNANLACEIVQRIPEGDRTVGDWLDLGIACGDARRDAEAVAATVTAQNLDDGRWRPWCLNNLVWFKLRLQPDASREVREGWLRDLEEARRLLAEQQPAAWKEVTVLCYGTEAEVRRALGDTKGAFRALAEAEELGPLNGTRLLIRARILAMGDPPLGRADAARALELLHPESSDARDARELLARLDARPEPAVTSPR